MQYRCAKSILFTSLFLSSACGDSGTTGGSGGNPPATGGNGGAPSGNICEQAAKDVRDRIEECGLEPPAPDPNGPSECTPANAATAACLAACTVAASCTALSGGPGSDDYIDCIVNCDSGEGGAPPTGGGPPTGGAPSTGGGPPEGGSGEGGGPPFTSCDAIGECQPAEGTIDPTESCFGCAVAGDTTVAPDGGICTEPYNACFGVAGDCSDGLPDCCAFYDCIDACDTNMNGGIEDGAELDCLCDNAPDPKTGELACTAQALTTPGTCVGDHNDGLFAALDWESCFFGDPSSGTEPVCPVSCQ